MDMERNRLTLCGGASVLLSVAAIAVLMAGAFQQWPDALVLAIVSLLLGFALLAIVLAMLTPMPRYSAPMPVRRHSRGEVTLGDVTKDERYALHA